MHQKELSDFRLADDTRCPTCGRTDFKNAKGMKQHHAKVHGESIAGVEIECEVCGGARRASPHEIEEDRGLFCSVDCRVEGRRERVATECEQCGDEFAVTGYREDTARFCSVNCKGAWRSENYTGENNPNWSDRIPLECKWCGGEYDVIPSRAEESSCCSEECAAAYWGARFNGDTHHSWRGGKSVYEAVKRCLGDESWPATRRRIRVRADGECQMCGGSPSGQGLDVHHIVPILSGGDHGDYNLMALCRSCHTTVEAYMWRLLDPVLIE